MAEQSLSPTGPNLSLWGPHPPPSNVSQGPGPGASRGPTSAALPLLLALVLLSLSGNALLLRRVRCGGLFSFCCRRGPRRKMDFFVAHLALADLYASLVLLFPDLVPWPPDGSWCRFGRFLQGSGKLVPSQMVLLLALERRSLLLSNSSSTASPSSSSFPCFLHHLLPPRRRGAWAGLSWLLALLLALPEAFAFSPALDGSCLSVFPHRPSWQRVAHDVYGAVTSFVGPGCLLGAICGHLLWTLLGKKEEEEEEEGKPPEPSRIGPSWPPGTPAVRLTLALAALFFLCGLPRCVLELASQGASSTAAAATLLSASQAALNPGLCLLFRRRRLGCCPCCGPRARSHHQQPRRQQQQQQRRRRRGAGQPQPPPQAALEPGPLWLCPCQAPQEEEGGSRTPDVQAGPSGL